MNEITNITYIDRLVFRLLGFARFKPSRKIEVAEKIDLFEGDLLGEPGFSLKFSYAGNVQYHNLTTDELSKLLAAGQHALNKVQSTHREESSAQ